jgi:hypothetical protein
VASPFGPRDAGPSRGARDIRDGPPASGGPTTSPAFSHSNAVREFVFRYSAISAAITAPNSARFFSPRPHAFYLLDRFWVIRASGNGVAEAGAVRC